MTRAGNLSCPPSITLNSTVYLRSGCPAFGFVFPNVAGPRLLAVGPPDFGASPTGLGCALIWPPPPPEPIALRTLAACSGRTSPPQTLQNTNAQHASPMPISQRI